MILCSLIYCMIGPCHSHAQDTLPPVPDTLPGIADSLKVPSFLTGQKDTSRMMETPVRPPRARGQRGQSAQPDQSRPEGGLEYGSRDSSFTDIIENKIHLYGQAYVRYQDFEVTADYILFDLRANEVEALSRPVQTAKPTFKTGTQVVTADRIRYNIDSEQGIVHGARVQQDQLYIHGAVTKFVKAGGDSLHIDDVIYNKNALVTTCDHEFPHWGIRTSKLKMIPEKLAVIGPFDMELGGIPTPVALPFAFAPLFSIGKSSSGLIFPQDPFYTSSRLGIGVRGLGYFFSISDRMNLALTGDIYTRGTFAINAASQYRKRYKYNGSINLSYSREIQDIASDIRPNIQKAYSISINHQQDAKAHPYRRIGGNLRFTINDFDRRNYSDANSQLNSQINSNFSYSYKLNSKTNFSSSIVHSQNTLNRSISFTLPELQLRMSRVFPFKKKTSSSSNEAWYEKINMQYNGRFQNKVSTVDTLLFTAQTLKDFRSGVSHEIDIGASYNLLEHFSFNTSAAYDEYWYFQTYRHTEADSLGNITMGEVIPDFKPLRDLSVSANITTNIFGTLQFAKGWLRGLRHRMTPTVGLSYSPSTEGYYEFFDIDPNDPDDELVRYNPFRAENGETLVFTRSLQQGGMSITYGLQNTFEGKAWSKKDSTEKKFKIFNSVNFNGSYNLQADSLNWSPISFTASAQLFKGKSRLAINGAFDPYVLNENGRRINVTTLSQDGKLFRLDRIRMSLNTSMSFRDIRDLFRGGVEDDSGSTSASSRGASRSGSRQTRKPGEPEELFSWFENFKIDHNIQIGLNADRTGLEVQTNSIRLQISNIPLSDKWSVGVDNISYNFEQKRWIYPSFRLSRDLHCWQMNISWQPQLDTYTFFIGVKASPFGDYIKYQTGRANFDGVNRFR